MKLALALCVALLAIVLLQAEDEIRPRVPRAETKITHGKKAKDKQFPYMAYILSEGPPANGPKHCAGSLISPHAVLTDAFCTHRHSKYTVRLGTIRRTGHDKNTWVVESLYKLIHPDFNASTYYSSVSIIYLPKKAPLNEYIKLVELPLPSTVRSPKFEFCDAIVSGWGKTNYGQDMSKILRWDEVTILPNVVCEPFFQPNEITNRTICAASNTTTVATGDDGAPLVLKTTSGYLQIGIHNRRPSNYYNTSKPAAYARVTSFVDWINTKIKSRN